MTVLGPDRRPVWCGKDPGPTETRAGEDPTMEGGTA